MEKLKKLTCFSVMFILFLNFLPLIAHGIIRDGANMVYEGTVNSQGLLQNSTFKDIQSHWARGAIQEAAALSVMSGTGGGQFQPNKPLTYAEALTVLVKAIGKDGEAQQYGEQGMPPKVRDIVLLSPVDNWARGYVQVALQNNIILPQEANEILNLSMQELESLEQQVEKQLQGFQDRDLALREILQLERQIREKLQNNARWNRPVSRQQVATWMARALKLEGVYGDQMVKIYGFNDWKQMDTDKIPFIEVILQKGLMSGTSDTAFSPKGQFTRGQMAQLVTNAQDDLLAMRGIKKYVGKVIDTEEVKEQGKNKRIITVQNDDNSRIFIAVTPVEEDFPVQKAGALRLSEALVEGDGLRYYVNNENKVIYGAVDQVDPKTIEGSIDFIDSKTRQLTVLDYSDQRHMFQVQPTVIVEINGKLGKFEDLLYGQEVAVTLIGDKVTDIKGYLEEDPTRHGYIPPESRTKVGDVLFISSDEVEIKTSEKREKYQLTPWTQILRNGRAANLFEVKVGDRVILLFDDIYSPEIATLRVEDDERHIDRIYQGVLEQVNQRSGEIILGRVDRYDQGKWQKEGDGKIRLKVEGDVLYQGGSKVSLQQLDRSKGREVYVAVENSYGVDRVAKLVTKQGSSVQYESRITDIQFSSNQMIVDNNRFFFHPGTIVVRDNRLVDPLNLDLNQTIHLAADLAGGTRNASFVSIEGSSILDGRIDGTRLAIYRGKIEDLHDYGVTIGTFGKKIDYQQLVNNRWEDIRRGQRFTVTDDTFIYDSELKKEIESKYFVDTRFLDPEDIDAIKDKDIRDRLKKNYYIDKNAYFVVKETTVDGVTYHELLALNLTPHIKHEKYTRITEHGATGTVSQIDIDKSTLTIKDMQYWNSLNEQWESTKRTETVYLDQAVIIINDKAISPEEIYRAKEGAKAYIIKNKRVSTGDDAYIIILEQ